VLPQKGSRAPEPGDRETAEAYGGKVGRRGAGRRCSARADRPAVPAHQRRLRRAAVCAAKPIAAHAGCLLTPRTAGHRRSRRGSLGQRRRPLGRNPMTAEVDANELRDAVERLHGCPAQLVEAVSVSESSEGRPAWRRIACGASSCPPTRHSPPRSRTWSACTSRRQACNRPVARRESQIQALDRTQPSLPMKPGRLGTMTHRWTPPVLQGLLLTVWRGGLGCCHPFGL
jgi:hypothetical protein